MRKLLSIKLLVLTLALVLSVGLFATSIRTESVFASEQCQTVNGAQQCEGGGSFGPGAPGGGGSLYSCGNSDCSTFQASGGGGGLVNPITGSPGGFGGHASCVDFFVCNVVGSQ